MQRNGVPGLLTGARVGRRLALAWSGCHEKGEGLWMKECGCGGRKSKPGLQDPVRNKDIHVGQRKQDCEMQLEGDSDVRVGLEMFVTQVMGYVSTALAPGEREQAQTRAMALEPYFGALGLTLAHMRS